MRGAGGSGGELAQSPTVTVGGQSLLVGQQLKKSKCNNEDYSVGG